jgi:ribonuclease HI
METDWLAPEVGRLRYCPKDHGARRGACASSAIRRFRDLPALPSVMVTQARSPHFLLYSETCGQHCGAPRWRFTLQSVGSEDHFSASDLELENRASRLELLAVVRGLEALDQPSRVTLVTRSRYVTRGIRRELGHWRDRRWRWERFGQLVPIRDHDLWRRVDRALQFHEVECITWTFAADPQLSAIAKPVPAAQAAPPEPALMIVPRKPARKLAPRTGAWYLAELLNTLRNGLRAPFSAVLRPAFTRAA